MDENPVNPPPVEGGTLQSSATLSKIAAALAAAHLNYDALIASQVADAEKYKYRYADLAGVLAAVQPALAKSGIAIVQSMSMTRPASGGGIVVAVETRFIHASGEWIATTLKLPSTETAPQKIGSLVTYLRRYGLLALAACASEDDDGAEAQRPEPTKRAPKAEPTTARPVPTNELPPAREKATKAKPVSNAQQNQSGAEPKPDTRHQPLSTPGSISAADRGLLFKTAKQQSLSERQVKALILALFGYTSTSQIRQGAEFVKVLSAMESPDDHGVTFAEDDTVYDRASDLNALPADVTEGM